MEASRVWYGAAIATCALWGGLLVLARSRRQWLTLNSWAGDAPRRLMYTNQLPYDMLDAVLHRASAVYSPAISSWRHWGLVLENRDLPFVEVMLLQPGEQWKPPGRLDSPTHPFIAPSLRIFQISSPTLFIANALDTLVLANSAPDQLAATIRELRSLRRFEIRDVISDEPVDWTTLIGQGTWPMLEELRIVCRRHQSYALAINAIAVSLPRLRELYATAAVLVKAPLAQHVHLVHARYVDYARVLAGTPSVTHTTLRGSADVRLPDFSTRVWPGAATIRLDSLISLMVFNDVENYGPGLFSALSAPSGEIRLYCDLRAAPNHQGVLDVDAILRTALNAEGTDASGFQRAFDHCRRALAISDQEALLSRLDVLNPRGMRDPSTPEMRRAAQNLLESVQERVNNPIVSHAEATLRDVLPGVAAAIRFRATDHEEHGTLEIEGQPYAGGRPNPVRYTVTARNVEGHTRRVTLYMTGRRVCEGWNKLDRWHPKDSMTWAASRMFAGLRIFDIGEITIVENGFDALERMTRSSADVAALASTLACYTSTHTLHFKFDVNATGYGMLRAIDSSSLPALKTIRIEGGSIDSSGENAYVPCYRAWFEDLEAALMRLQEAGRALEMLKIEGHVCLCQFWIARVRALVGTLRVDVTCTRGVGEVCIFCRTSSAEIW
ncbi:hypothetical protein PENSPDRAFT_658917 [Peniophora sp. CONT]|nr:hypothetical protein PENSPDRAFT_658917 [Peniophora sp. CONT]